MAAGSPHKWAFKRAMRDGAYGWRSSAKAVARIKSAVSEIKAVNRSDPAAAADGVLTLAERIWPAFEFVDTSSGALGGAVHRAVRELVPILIAAPADEPTRAAWLERLHTAIQDDEVEYLGLFSERFGEIAAYRSLQDEYADFALPMIRQALAEHSSFAHVVSGTLTLSCLLEAGRHDELAELVALVKHRSWFYCRYVAESLLRQGREDEALEYAEELLRDESRVSNADKISRFCESILVRQGREEEAYRRFGLPSASGGTYLAMWRDMAKRYPDRDARGILEDLMAIHGTKGKWFAAAKTAKFLDIALECARHDDAAPATLLRAARDFEVEEPRFAAQVALDAITQMINGRGYEEASPRDVDAAIGHLVAASARAGLSDAALRALKQLGGGPDSVGWARQRVRRAAERIEAEGGPPDAPAQP